MLTNYFLLFFKSQLHAEGNPDKVKELGVSNARLSSLKVHYDYFSCYALHEGEKRSCVKSLNEKYARGRMKDDPLYIKEFQYEAERLGFRDYINAQELLCDRIDHGPELNEEKGGYIVQCKMNTDPEIIEYLMFYDYKNRQWRIDK